MSSDSHYVAERASRQCSKVMYYKWVYCTVGRVIEVFTAQQGDLWLFDEQLRRWERGPLTSAQRQEVERLAGQMLQLHEVISAILRLAEQLQERTIEKVLAKSDAELGLEMLLNGWPTDLK
jgi:hypothetical protein